MNKNIVILGAGQAGFQTAVSLRENGFEGRIALIGDERDPPYERPPLSKTYLIGEKSREGLQFRPEKFYAAQNIDLVLDERATEIDRSGRNVLLSSGKQLAYDHLVLATGARNRQLPMGSDLDGVLYVRTLAEADALQKRLVTTQEVVIIGAGFIGLELAAVLRKLGKRTRVLEAAPRVMSRAVSPVTSVFFAGAHAAWGTEVVTDVSVSEIVGHAGKVTGVLTSERKNFGADLVLVGVGVVPNAELAAAAGLEVRGGIVVDAQLSTSDPAISAIGDCAIFPSQFANAPIRLESVQNAIDQARCLAGRLVGRATNYTSVPWFWSDQADLKLQMVGITANCDGRVIRGDPATRAFSVFCFSDGRFIGIESVNKPGDHMFGRRLLGVGAGLTPAQAVDASFDLKAHLAEVTRTGH